MGVHDASQSLKPYCSHEMIGPLLTHIFRSQRSIVRELFESDAVLGG